MTERQIERKYPLSLFFIGMLTNSILLLLLALLFLILLFVLRAFFNQIPLFAPFLLLAVWFIKSLVEQLGIRKATLEKSENAEFNRIMDSVFDKESPNDWKQNFRDMVEK